MTATVISGGGGGSGRITKVPMTVMFSQPSTPTKRNEISKMKTSHTITVQVEWGDSGASVVYGSNETKMTMYDDIINRLGIFRPRFKPGDIVIDNNHRIMFVGATDEHGAFVRIPSEDDWDIISWQTIANSGWMKIGIQA